MRMAQAKNKAASNYKRSCQNTANKNWVRGTRQGNKGGKFNLPETERRVDSENSENSSCEEETENETEREAEAKRKEKLELARV